MVHPIHPDRPTVRRVLAVGLGIGALAGTVLFGSTYGVNVPIVVVALLAGAWLVRRPGRHLDPLDTWLPLAAVVLAALVGIRGDPVLVALDTAAALACVGAAVAAIAGIAVTRRAASAIAAIAGWTLVSTVVRPVLDLERTRPFRYETSSGPPPWVVSLARGLIIGTPLAVIFAILFASADPIFRRTVADALGYRIDLGDLPGRVVFALMVAWLATGLLSVGAFGIPEIEGRSLGAATRAAQLTVPRVLGRGEALVILVTIDLVVGFFVALQVAYLFGGLDTLQAIGMTYADYARRGFFELLAAAGLAALIVATLEAVVVERSRIYVAAVLALVVLTAAVLASAALRLSLYQDAYGWTELRAWVLAAIATMGVGLAAMAILVVADRSRWLGHAFVAIGLIALIGLNVAAPAAIVATHNVARVIDPSIVPLDGHHGLDLDYLAVLPDDAIPVLVEALLRVPEPDRTVLAGILRARRAELARDRSAAAPWTWNLGRERARAALASLT